MYGALGRGPGLLLMDTHIYTHCHYAWVYLLGLSGHLVLDTMTLHPRIVDPLIMRY